MINNALREPVIPGLSPGPREQGIRQRRAERLQRRYGCCGWSTASDECLNEWFAFLRKRAVNSAIGG